MGIEHQKFSTHKIMKTYLTEDSPITMLGNFFYIWCLDLSHDITMTDIIFINARYKNNQVND